jgi:hypothetical protein
VSLIQPGNPASERVARKTGLEKVARLERHGRTYFLYEASTEAGEPSPREPGQAAWGGSGGTARS